MESSSRVMVVIMAAAIHKWPAVCTALGFSCTSRAKPVPFLFVA